MTRYISLFRGINVGKQKKVSMGDLKKFHQDLGFQDVVTYIRTGNVLFTATEEDSEQIATQISEKFAQTFGFRSNVLVRSAAEFEKVVEHNPFINQPTYELKWIVVLFLASRPDPLALQELQKAYTGPEEMYLIDQALYMYYPNNIGNSKLTLPLVEKYLKTSGTGRNWNTMLQLQQLLQK